MSRGGQEVEIKLPLAGAAAGRRLLRRAGFRVALRRVLETNAVFDTESGSLRAAGSLLRLRRAGGRSILTFKGPSAGGKHKSREEVETAVADARSTEVMLHRLGYRPVFLYEKYRTEYAPPRRGGMITLDETPIGDFLELEGSPGWIDRTAHRLGFSESDYITASYGRLYLDHCARTGRTPGSMVFGPRRKRSLVVG